VLNRSWLALVIAGMSLGQTGVDYLMVTPAELAPAFDDFVFWKTRKGLAAEVVPMETVLVHSSGRDRAEKVRNYLKMLHDSLGTTWVLLAGDTMSVPTRMVFTPGNLTDYSPCDMYFSDLTGSWDGDGDNIFGEEDDSIDFHADVFVARAPLNDTPAVKVLVQKWLEFEKHPEPGFLKRLIRAGDTTHLGVPAGWFEAGLTNPPAAQELRDSLNAGFQLAWHLGHSDGQALIVGTQTVLDSAGVPGLTNFHRQGVLLTVGSLAAAFDRGCIGSALIKHNNGGSVAVLANTRAGWVNTSEILAYQFFHNLFNTDTGYELGRNQARTRDRYVTLARTQWRWRQALYVWTLLGEPNLPLWKDEPRTLTVNHPVTLDTGPQWFPIEVSSSGQPVRARVCLWKGPEVYERRWVWGTDTIPIHPLTPGTMLLTVTAADHRPYEDSCGVGVGVGDKAVQPPVTTPEPLVSVNGGKTVMVMANVPVHLEAFAVSGRRLFGSVQLEQGAQRTFTAPDGIVFVQATVGSEASSSSIRLSRRPAQRCLWKVVVMR